MTYITRIANKRILAKYFLYSLQVNYLHWKLSASRSIFSCYATFFEDNSIITQSAQLMTFYRQVSYLIPGNLHMPVGIQLDARLRQELMVQCNTI